MDLFITSESHHYSHLGEIADSSTSTVRTRPGMSTQALSRLSLSLSLSLHRRGAEVSGSDQPLRDLPALHPPNPTAGRMFVPAATAFGSARTCGTRFMNGSSVTFYV
jgi:hypothetical protein